MMTREEVNLIREEAKAEFAQRGLIATQHTWLLAEILERLISIDESLPNDPS